MDLDEAAEELYGLLPERFTARRAELAARAGAEGDSAARAAIGKLRRPAAAAWLVNLLARTHAAELDRLLALGAELRDAQRTLAGDRLRELSARRRSQIALLVELAGTAAADAGGRATDDALRDVQATLEAAVADPAAGAAVRAGRLTGSLSYSGFGEVDLSDAVATPPARPPLSVVPPSGGKRAGGKAPSKQAASKQAASKQVASKQAASKQAASKQAASKQAASKQVASKQPASKRAASKQVASKQAASKQAARPDPRVDEARRAAQRRAAEADTARRALEEATGRRDDTAAAVARLEKDLEAERRELRTAETRLRAAKQQHEAAERAARRTAARLRELDG